MASNNTNQDVIGKKPETGQPSVSNGPTPVPFPSKVLEVQTSTVEPTTLHGGAGGSYALKVKTTPQQPGNSSGVTKSMADLLEEFTKLRNRTNRSHKPQVVAQRS